MPDDGGCYVCKLERRNTGVSREHAWNLVEVTERRPGDTEVVHECSYCGERAYGMDVGMPLRGCAVGSGRKDG